MTSAPTGDSGDALERLRDEQWHILELFDTCARYQRGTDLLEVEAGRVATLIYTLLRVHCELETMLLLPLTDEANFRATQVQIATRRSAMLDALERRSLVAARYGPHARDGCAGRQRAGLVRSR